MGKKGKKTRWRRLPIGGADEEGGLSLEAPPPTSDPHRITFNEDEYTKITTPRQDVLFKKGYFGRKRNPNPSPSETQEVHSGDSVESESYTMEEPQYAYPAGYMDASGVYYVNGSTYETYDPYTGTVTVVVGPPAQYPGGPPVFAAVPCQPVPLQQVEWFNPPAPWNYNYNRKKRYSTDSQNCSAQSSESTGPPGSPQELGEEGACAMYPPQYVYPGYMFGPPIYNMNGVTVQGMIPQPVPPQPDLAAVKRRKKRRRRRRGGVTDDGSESSCYEEPLTCDVQSCQSGASSDAGGSKANSDSGINTDPTPNSGSNSPPLHIDPVLAQVNGVQCDCLVEQIEHDQSASSPSAEENELVVSCASQESQTLPLCSYDSVVECTVKDDGSEAITPEEVSEELSSTTEDDLTTNLNASVLELSSQECTLSCLSTSITKDSLPDVLDTTSNADTPSDEVFECSLLTTDSLNCNEPIQESDVVECAESQPDSTVSSESSTDQSNDNDEEPLQIAECLVLSVSEKESTFIPEETLLSKEVKYSVTEELPMSNTEEVPVTKESEDVAPGEVVITDLEPICQAQTITNNSESLQIQSLEQLDASVIWLEDDVDLLETIVSQTEEEKETVTKPLSIKTSTNVAAITTTESDCSFLEKTLNKETLTPVPPPRRKRSLCRAADKIATRIVGEAIREGVEEAVCARLRGPSPISITEAVTRWLHSQGSSPLTCPISESESSDEDDEGIEVEEGLTGPKNVRGNPFPVSFLSVVGQRVAKDCESVSVASSAGEWDLWDHNHTREMCDPTRSVDKYYHLGADEVVGDKVSPSVYKTAMHIRHNGPFPCGVCCIIQ